MSRPHRRTAVLAAVAAVPLLAGCTQDRLGTAAVIDDRAVSSQELQEATRAYLDIVPGGDPGETQLAILQRVIVSEVIDEVAREHGIRVREGRVAAERDDILGTVGNRRDLIRTLAQSQQVIAPSDVDRWVKDRLLFDRIASDICDCDVAVDSEEAQEAFTAANDELRDTSADMDIQISPRYGEWDPDRGITPLVSGGLSKTVDELRADDT
jgi:hypothetical protein